jgi:hypothetical protein
LGILKGGKMVKEFEVGKYYRYIRKEKHTNWTGEMDVVLDNQPRKCLGVKRKSVKFEGMVPWEWDFFDAWEEVPKRNRGYFIVINEYDIDCNNRTSYIINKLKDKGYFCTNYSHDSKSMYINNVTKQINFYDILPKVPGFTKISLQEMEQKLETETTSEGFSKHSLEVCKIMEKYFHKEVKEKMEAPKTILEKKACSKAVEEAIKKSIEKKQVIYDDGMRSYIEREHELIRLRISIESLEAEQILDESKFSITEEMKKELF